MDPVFHMRYRLSYSTTTTTVVFSCCCCRLQCVSGTALSKLKENNYASRGPMLVRLTFDNIVAWIRSSVKMVVCCTELRWIKTLLVVTTKLMACTVTIGALLFDWYLYSESIYIPELRCERIKFYEVKRESWCGIPSHFNIFHLTNINNKVI